MRSWLHCALSRAGLAEHSGGRIGPEDAAGYFFFLGTLAPERRASDSPIAIACLRLRTLMPERPLLSLPRFISCIARLTFPPLALPYLRAIVRSFHR